MGIKANFNIDDLFKEVTKNVEILMLGVIEAMNKTCLEVTAAAKQLDTYKDQTNNLRSSIGFVVYNQGKKVTEHFTKVGAGIDGNGSSGMSKGIEVANEAAKARPDKIVGVVVAGEDYALYVESQGLDVITGPCSQLKEVFESNLKIVLQNMS